MLKKDIFIDNNIAKNFSNPLDPEYKKLIKWLMTCDDKNPMQNAYLMLSQKLLIEYGRSARDASSSTNIAVIIDKLISQGRYTKISNQQIKDFKQDYFSKKVIRRLTCNKADREHIPVVLLSDRKYALSLDNAFIHDLRNFPGFVVLVAKRPQDLPYQK